MDRSTMLKLMHRINKYYKVFHKYMPYLSSISIIISIWDRIKSTKLTVFLKRLLKILIIINIIFGVGLIVYYTDIITPVTTTYSIYSHLIEPYLQIIINLYNELINYYNTIISQFKIVEGRDFFNNQGESVSVSQQVEQSIHGIKDEVKEGIKSGIKEVIQDLKDDLAESELNQSILLKQIVIFSTVLFGIYFIFILPSGTEGIQDYSWLNQGLINIKLSIIDLFSNPSNPGTPPTTPILRTLADVGVSPIISEASTITPNTPCPPIQTLTQYVNASTQTEAAGGGIDASVETSVNAITVSKMVETINILKEVLDDDVANTLTDGVNKVVKSIID